MLGLAGTVPLTTTGAKPAFNGRAAPRPWRAYLPSMPVSKQRRRWAVAQLATALLLLVTLLAIYFAFRPTNHEAVAPVGGTPTAIAAPTVPANVPMFRGNPARTGVLPGPGLVGQPTLLWQAKLDHDYSTAPAVVDGTIYIADGGFVPGTLYAIDAATGTERWRFALGGPAVFSAPAVAAGTVYVGGDALYAVDAANGKQRWRFATAQNVVSAPVVVDGVVFFGCDDANVYAVDAATGTERWHFATSQSIDAVWSPPSVVDGVVYVGSNAGFLFALDAATGAERWRFKTQSGLYQTSSPAVADGVVYIASYGGNVFAIDAATGTERWQFKVDGNNPVMMSSPVVGGGVVYVGSMSGWFYALDAATGAVVWKLNLGVEVAASPVLVDGVLYLGTNGRGVLAVDAATGTERWHYQTKFNLPSPVVANGVLYVSDVANDTEGGFLYALVGDNSPSTPAA